MSYKYKVTPLVPEDKWETKPQYDERDYQYPLTAISDLKEDIINSKRITHIKEQVNGSCTGESMSYAIDWATGDYTSGEFAYLMAKKYDGLQIEGSSLLAVCKAAQKDGVCLDSLYPRVGKKNWYEYPQPSNEAIQDAQTRKIDGYYQIYTVEQIHHALKIHGKVIIGVLVASNFMHPEIDQNGNAFVDLPNGYILGAHAMTMLDSFPNLEYKYKNGITRKGFFRLPNSWGTGYGKHGYIYLPYDFIAWETDIGINAVIDMRVIVDSLNNKAKVIDLDIAPFIIDGRTVLPIRHLTESLGAVVNWYGSEGRVEIIKNDTLVNMFINSNIVYVNGEEKRIDIAPFTVKVNGGERTMLPARYVAEFLGGIVDYHKGDQKIHTTLQDRNVYMFVDRKYLVIK